MPEDIYCNFHHAFFMLILLNIKSVSYTHLTLPTTDRRRVDLGGRRITKKKKKKKKK